MQQIITSMLLCISNLSLPLSTTFMPLSEVPITAEDPEDDQELQFINRQIESLENLKEYYSAKAVRYRNRGDRLQYETDSANILESRKLWKQADQYDKIADRIQTEIDKLQIQKERLE